MALRVTEMAKGDAACRVCSRQCTQRGAGNPCGSSRVQGVQGVQALYRRVRARAPQAPTPEPRSHHAYIPPCTPCTPCTSVACQCFRGFASLHQRLHTLHVAPGAVSAVPGAVCGAGRIARRCWLVRYVRYPLYIRTRPRVRLGAQAHTRAPMYSAHTAPRAPALRGAPLAISRYRTSNRTHPHTRARRFSPLRLKETEEEAQTMPRPLLELIETLPRSPRFHLPTVGAGVAHE